MVRGFRDGDELKKMEERSSKARCGSCGGGGKCEGEAESFGVEGDGIRERGCSVEIGRAHV